LTLVRFSLDWQGLFAAVMFGGALYVLSAIALDVGEVRTIGMAVLRKRLHPNVAALTD
jgi:hypothetical protein